MNVLIDMERLRNPHSGLGQFCRRLGEELVRQLPADARLTFLVPAGQGGVFGGEATYRAATMWRRFRPDPGIDVWHIHYNHLIDDHAGVVEWFKGSGLRPLLQA